MEDSTKVTLPSSKYPCSENSLLAQENLSDTKERVKAFNKTVESIEPTILFELQLDLRVYSEVSDPSLK